VPEDCNTLQNIFQKSACSLALGGRFIMQFACATGKFLALNGVLTG
jgi:hypothetical protein